MEQLRPFRDRIDDLDERILALLGERFDVCREVARFKKANGIPMMQRERNDEVLEHFVELGERHRFPDGFALALFDVVVDWSCRLEDSIIEAPDADTLR